MFGDLDKIEKNPRFKQKSREEKIKERRVSCLPYTENLLFRI